MERLQYIAAVAHGIAATKKIEPFTAAAENMKATLVQSFVSTCALLSLCSGAPITNSSDSAADRCCTLLRLSNAGETFIPTDPGYQSSIDSYWSNSSKIEPTCIVTPSDTNSVSGIVVTLVNNTCPFAIRSGGHNPFPDNNIAAPGITVDLQQLNSTTVADSVNGKGQVAKIGPGARWGAVYDTLSPLDLAVPGGRAASVGVGGLVLGGGNSFFSAKYGFVADNVENFEIVLANGTITNANANSNPELWTALKGGSNNFGVVTRIDLTVFKLPGGKIWGGTVFYPETSIPDQIDAFVDFTDNIENDPSASLITFWAYSSATNVTVVQNCYEYTDPTKNLTEAPIFQKKLLTKLGPELPFPPPAKSNTLRFDTLTSLTKELEAPKNIRDLFATLSFANDAKIINDTYRISQEILAPIKEKNIPGLSWITMFQPVPTIFNTAGKADGRSGNVMGLDRANKNQVLFLFFVGWNNTADDQLMYDSAKNLTDQVKQLSIDQNKANDWIYLNYATAGQQVLQAYGTENLNKIGDAAKKYDPTGVFQTLVPGGNKVSKAGYPQWWGGGNGTVAASSVGSG